MITTETVYRASDGRQFPTAAEAEEYQVILIKKQIIDEFVKPLSKAPQIRGAMAKAILAWELK